MYRSCTVAILAIRPDRRWLGCVVVFCGVARSLFVFWGGGIDIGRIFFLSQTKESVDLSLWAKKQTHLAPTLWLCYISLYIYIYIYICV